MQELLDLLALAYYGSMKEPTATEQIDAIIAQYGGWKGALLAELRAAIKAVEFHEGNTVPIESIQRIVAEGIRLNAEKTTSK